VVDVVSYEPAGAPDPMARDLAYFVALAFWAMIGLVTSMWLASHLLVSVWRLLWH